MFIISVETLKRNYDGQEQTGDLHEQQTRHQQAPSDEDQQHHSNQQQEQHHQQETNWGAYFYHVVYEIESGSLPSVYYNGMF